MEKDQEGGDTKRLSLLRKVEGRGEREAFVFARSFVVFFFFIFSQLWVKRGKIERKEGMEWNGTKRRVFGGEGRRVATIEFVKWISSWRTGLSDLFSFHGNEKICVSFNFILLLSASIFLNFPEIWCFLVIQSFKINSWIREKLTRLAKFFSNETKNEKEICHRITVTIKIARTKNLSVKIRSVSGEYRASCSFKNFPQNFFRNK